MELTDIVTRELSRAKNFLFTPKEKSGMLTYLTDVELRDHFAKASEEQRTGLYQRLEHHLEQSILKYSSYLDSWKQKVPKIAGYLTALSDAAALAAKLPGASYSHLHVFMVLAKTVAEAPGMFYYLVKSKDYLGALKWLGIKPFELLIPVLGPWMGAGWTEKIVRQRIMYEAKQNFLKELGLAMQETYKPLDRRAADVTGYNIQPKYA